MRYEQWWWCWKSICIALPNIKASTSVLYYLEKSHFPNQPSPSAIFFCHQPGGAVSVSWPLYADLSRWTWRPDLRSPIDPLAELDSHDRRGKGWAPHLWWTLAPSPSPRVWRPTGGPTYPVSSISNHSRLNSGHFPNSYHHRELINTGTLSQNASSNTVSTYEFWPGSVCDHWGGKEPWPGGYTEEPQRGEPFEQSLNPGGLQVWLTMLLSMLGHNLKGDQSVVPQSSKALFLPPRLCRSLFLHTRSLTIFSYLPTTENFFVNSGLNMHKTCRKWTKKLS